MTAMQVVEQQDLLVFERGLEEARAILPPGIDLRSEDEFIQAGAMLVEYRRRCLLALGELLEWKLKREQAADHQSRSKILGRYAHAWGTSKSSLVKAWVVATKFRGITRPEDIGQTLIYEVLSGSDEPEHAEAGFDQAALDGMTTEQIREAKMLQAEGLNVPDDWHVPELVWTGRGISVKIGDGELLEVFRVTERQDMEARRAIAVARRRLRV